jgi:pentatricopeptide repeat protein
MKRLNDAGQFSKALTLFDELERREIPRDQAIVQALKACTRMRLLERGVNIHKKLSNRSKSDKFIQSTLVSFYSQFNLSLCINLPCLILVQCGDVTHARRIFSASSEKSLPLCGAMMKGTIYLSMWNTLLTLSDLGFVVNNLAHEAIELFSTISNPDRVILILLFNSCAQLGTPQALETGRQALTQMPSIHRTNQHILTSVLDMFIRCGDVSSAEKWFSNMESHVITYGQIMKCYNEEKLPMKTLGLYEKMKSEHVKPDLVTFLLLIDACCQLGIESICRSIVEQIPPAVLVNIQIKSALIDMWVGQWHPIRPHSSSWCSFFD